MRALGCGVPAGATRALGEAHPILPAKGVAQLFELEPCGGWQKKWPKKKSCREAGGRFGAPPSRGADCAPGKRELRRKWRTHDACWRAARVEGRVWCSGQMSKGSWRNRGAGGGNVGVFAPSAMQYADTDCAACIDGEAGSVQWRKKSIVFRKGWEGQGILAALPSIRQWAEGGALGGRRAGTSCARAPAWFDFRTRAAAVLAAFVRSSAFTTKSDVILGL